MNIFQFPLNLSKLALISSVALAYSAPLMAMDNEEEQLQEAMRLSLSQEKQDVVEESMGWNESILFLEDANDPTIKKLQEKCITKIGTIDDNEKKLNKWLHRLEKVNKIIELPKRDLESAQLMLVDEELIKEFKENQPLPQNVENKDEELELALALIQLEEKDEIVKNDEKELKKVIKLSISENAQQQTKRLEDDIEFAEILELSEKDINHAPQNLDENDEELKQIIELSKKEINNDNDEELKQIIELSKIQNNNDNDEEIQRAIRENNEENKKPQNMLEELKKWIKIAPKNKDKHSATTNKFTLLKKQENNNNNDKKDDNNNNNK